MARRALPGLRALAALSAALGLAAAGAARADELVVAVAANFTVPMQRIAAGFEQESGHRLKLAFGATGKFYAQIKNGAPFDVLLAADARTPERLVREGDALPDSRMTYAVGRLVLWSPRPGLVDAQGAVLRRTDIAHIAVCDPALAPYGAAAFETIHALGLDEALRPRLVQAENIAQAYQFVASGNAEIGFVALSQVFENGQLREGSAWMVPAGLYAPLRQDAVALKRTAHPDAARALLMYLASPKARRIIHEFGYAD